MEEQPNIQEVPVGTEVTIRLTPEGNLNVQTNSPNKVVVMGMLELAKTILADQNKQASGPGLFVAGRGMPRLNGR